jgi:hypothetical protein
LSKGSFKLQLKKRKLSSAQSTDPKPNQKAQPVFNNLNIPKLRQVVHIVFNILQIHSFQLLSSVLAVEKNHKKPKLLLNEHSNNLQRQHSHEFKRLLVQRKLQYLLNGGVWGKSWNTRAGSKALDLMRHVSAHKSFSSLLPFELRRQAVSVFQTHAVSTQRVATDDQFYVSRCLFRHLLPFLQSSGILKPAHQVHSAAAWFDFLASNPVMCTRVSSVEHRDRSFSFSFRLSEADETASLQKKHKLMFRVGNDAFILFVSAAYVVGRLSDTDTKQFLFFTGPSRKVRLQAFSPMHSCAFTDCGLFHLNEGYSCDNCVVPASAVLCEALMVRDKYAVHDYRLLTPDSYSTSLNWLGMPKKSLRPNMAFDLSQVDC